MRRDGIGRRRNFGKYALQDMTAIFRDVGY